MKQVIKLIDNNRYYGRVLYSVIYLLSNLLQIKGTYFKSINLISTELTTHSFIVTVLYFAVSDHVGVDILIL